MFQANLRFFQAKIKTYFRCDRGAIAPLYGILSVLLLLLAGVATDYGRAHYIKKEINRALDAGVIAAAALVTEDEDRMREEAEKYFFANLSERTRATYNPQISLAFEEGTIRGVSNAEVATVLMNVVNIESLDVAATSEVNRATRYLEIALVLDATGSMVIVPEEGKLEAMQSAAKDLISSLYALDEENLYTKFAVVPFSGSVNITGNIESDDLDSVPSWIDINGVSQSALDDFPANRTYTFNGWVGMTGRQALEQFVVDYSGCVKERFNTPAGTMASMTDIDLSDTAPDPMLPNTLFAPFIYSLEFLAEGGAREDIINALRNVQGCPPSPIVPLTNSEDALVNAIDNFSADGGTVIPVGLAWGRRVLSPGAPFTQGAADDDAVKIIVLLTDGENDYDIAREYSAYGLSKDFGRLGHVANTNATLNEKTAQLCDDIVEDGILIFTITFRVTDTTTQDLMRQCATNDSMHFNAETNSDLGEAFEAIGAGLQKFRLAH